MNDWWEPKVLLASPLVSGLLGSIIGLRAVNGTTWAGRAFNLFGAWACAVLFGPAMSGILGTTANPEACAAVIGATGVFGLVIVDGVVRYLKDTPILDVVVRLLSVFKGGGK